MRASLPVLAAGVLMAFGCGLSSEDAEPPLARFAASEAVVADLSIASWEVRNDGDDLQIVGRDAAAATRADLLLSRGPGRPDDELLLTVRFPEAGSARLHRDGTVEGASSVYLRRIATAVTSDIGEHGQALALPDAAAKAGVDSVSQALYLGSSGAIPMPFTLWGYSTSVITGPPGDNCGSGQTTGLHADFSAFSTGGSSCWVVNWFDPLLPTDCRVVVHIGDHGWHSDTCNWTVHWNTLQ